MVTWLMETKEYVFWGWNMATLGTVGTAILTLYQLAMLRRQNSKIWSGECGDSVSVTAFSFMCFFLLAFACYGYYGKSLSVIFNGVSLGFLECFILVGLWKFKGYSKKEWLSVVLSFLMVPGIIILPWKDQVYMVCAVGSVLGLAFQPLEIYREKKSGVVDIGLIFSCLVSTLFWLIFTYFTGLMFVFSISASIFVVLLTTVILWFKYRAE